MIKYRLSTKIMRLYRKLPFSIPGINRVIISILGIRLYAKKKYLNFVVTDKKELESWYSDKKIFFGLGIIRSGTTFLSNFLNSSLDKAVIKHEAIPEDFLAYAKAFNNEDEALEYIKKFRYYEIYNRVKKTSGLELYGEINPFLRRHIRALKEVYPQAKYFYITRDGRDVVRSIMSRANLGKKDSISAFICPPIGDKWHERWSEMNRFERVCWWWQAENKYMRENIEHAVKFEELRKSYSYFKTNILDFLGISITREQWGARINRVANPTKTFHLPNPSEWTKEQKESFDKICGEEMKINGYY